MTQFNELLEMTKRAVATVGRLTEDKVKLTALCEQANKNTDDAFESAKKAMAGAKELMEMLTKVTNEKDRYKSLRDIDAHRIQIATCSIEALEEEKRDLEEEKRDLDLENRNLKAELKEINGE